MLIKGNHLSQVHWEWWQWWNSCFHWCNSSKNCVNEAHDSSLARNITSNVGEINNDGNLLDIDALSAGNTIATNEMNSIFLIISSQLAYPLLFGPVIRETFWFSFMNVSFVIKVSTVSSLNNWKILGGWLKKTSRIFTWRGCRPFFMTITFSGTISCHKHITQIQKGITECLTNYKFNKKF